MILAIFINVSLEPALTGNDRRRALDHDPADASKAVQWAVDHLQERKAVMDEHKGRVDGKAVNKVVASKLA